MSAPWKVKVPVSYSAWGDLLTNYDGTTINYDNIGNPTNWRNATSLTWNGRKLTGQSISSNESLDYSYDSSGIRTRKYYINYSTYTLHDHTYVLDGTNIIKETIQSNVIGAPSTDVLYYYYDESGISGFEYNGTNYYFLKNIQGDVINILNSSGQVVVTYTYDAWGKVLSTTGSLANTIVKMVANKPFSSINTILTEVLHEKEPNSYGFSNFFNMYCNAYLFYSLRKNYQTKDHTTTDKRDKL